MYLTAIVVMRFLCCVVPTLRRGDFQNCFDALWPQFSTTAHHIKNFLNKKEKEEQRQLSIYILIIKIKKRNLVPCHWVQYYLSEWSQALENASQLFNLKYSKLQNMIERIFDFFKKISY